MNTPSIIPAKRRIRRKRRTAASSSPAPPPAALMLVSASFDAGPGGAILRLTFNKPVDVEGIFPGNLQVDDAVSATQWEGQGPVTFVNPSTIDVGMFEIQAQAYPDTRLNALEPAGIVAVEDGGAWAGVADLLLPYP